MIRLFIAFILCSIFTAAFASVHQKVWVTGGLINQSIFTSTELLLYAKELQHYTSDDDVLVYKTARTEDNTFLFEVYPGYAGKVRLEFFNNATNIPEKQCIFFLKVDKNLKGQMDIVQDGEYVHCKLEGNFADNSFKIIITDVNS